MFYYVLNLTAAKITLFPNPPEKNLIIQKRLKAFTFNRSPFAY